MGIGSWSSTLPEPVLRDGAPTRTSSVVSAYSNSNPMKRKPPPIARPSTARLAGVVVAPAKSVMSAAAGAAHAAVNASAKRPARSPCIAPPVIDNSTDSTLLMDFRFTDDQQLLRRSVRDFAETEIRPHVREWDEAQHFPAEIVPTLASLGLMGIQVPEQYGGAGMSAIDYCICIEELARVDPGLALSVAAHNGLCSAHILFFGNEAQKQRYLTALATGEKLGAWGLTESTSGSDAAGMRTAASKTGNCWTLNGSKTFTTHGRSGDVMVVMAVTDRAAQARGISAFIVERGTPGMTPGKKEDKLGMRASETSEVLFENCRIPLDQILGEEGLGFVGAMQVLDAGRIGIAALSVGLAQGAYEAALRYAQERKAFGKTISAFQAIQWKLADTATRIEAAGR